jgi:hypothetical protein
MNKYFSDIMPKIRETGQYIVNNNEQEKINKLNDKIKNLKMKNDNLTEENIFLDKKYRFKPSESGYLYIISISCIKRGKRILCYKYGVTDDMDNRYKVYLVGNPNCKLLYYVPLDIDKKILEGCINNITKLHDIKINNESKEFNSIEELKNIIINCYSFIKNHHCSCFTCQKELKFNNIDTHFCDNNNQLQFINPYYTNIGRKHKKSSKKLSKKSSKKSSKKLYKKLSKKSSKKLSKKSSKKSSKKL